MSDIAAPAAADPMSADWATQVAARLNTISAGRRPMAAGTVRVALTERVSETIGRYYRGHARVDFPPGLFSAGPVVCLSANSAYPGTMITASFTGISHTGMTVYIARSGTVSTTVHWIAVAADSATDSGMND